MKISDIINQFAVKVAGPLALLLGFAACSDDVKPVDVDVTGDAVSFVTFAPASALTLTRAYEVNTAITSKYQKTDKEYEFTVGLYKPGVNPSDPPVLLGEELYKSQAYADNDVFNELSPKTNPLQWPDNVKPYGFTAKANYDPLESDQTTEANFFKADKVTGFSFVPLYDESKPESDPEKYLAQDEQMQFYTRKVWQQYNAVLYGTDEGHIDYKSIPIFIRHDRVWITVVLKAGKGVRREDVAFAKAAEDIVTTVSSYTEPTPGVFVEKKIQPLASEILVDYEADANGPAANGVSSTQYDAIVEPFGYWTNKTKTICNVALSTQKFSFAAENDTKHPDDATREANYNLPAGKHLTITATLTDDRIVLLTAKVEDWTEKITTTMVNDFGMMGDPIYIPDKKTLIDFLKDDTQNKSGNYAIVTADIDLNSAVGEAGYPDSWSDVSTSKDLKATLNLAGYKITTTGQFLNKIDGGNLLNGQILVDGDGTAPSYVAHQNTGKIEQIELVAAENHTPKASVAGMVEINNKYIFNCSSDIPVYATTGYAGGIAGTSLNNGTITFADIEDCRVLAAVKGSGVTAAGGIVGQANGTVTNNTFDYGITISQNASVFKNIIGEKETSATLTASGNKWPTTDTNADAGTNATAAADLVNGVMDCQEDLLQSLTKVDGSSNPIYNKAGIKCKLVHDLELNSSWDDSKDIKYNLLGCNKVITTNGKRIFNDIYNNVQDVIIHVNAIISNTSGDNSSIASSLGNHLIAATIDNIRVKTATGVYIEASNPGGLLFQAQNGAIISNCQFNGKLKVSLATDIGDGRAYAGGIVARTNNATIDRCVCHGGKDAIVHSDDGHAEGSTVYYGGIVGAVLKDSYSTLVITNCTSNFYVANEADKIRKGAIVGSIYYVDSSIKINATTTGSTGNWWEYTDDAGNDKHFNVPIATGGWVPATGLDVTDLIGKRNAVKPTLDTEW